MIDRSLKIAAAAAAVSCAIGLGAGSAQTLQAPTTGGMRATDIGMEPMMRVSPRAYATHAAELEAYQAAATALAARRSASPRVRALAGVLASGHRRIAADLAGARASSRPKSDPDVARMLAALASASPAAFDRLFLAQQVEAHRRAWALHSGFAADGADPALRAVATRAVRIEEDHLHRLPMRPMRY